MMAMNHMASCASVSMNSDSTSAAQTTMDMNLVSWSLPLRPAMNLASFSRI